jgi:hypothetical protein
LYGSIVNIYSTGFFHKSATLTVIKKLIEVRINQNIGCLTFSLVRNGQN